MSKVAKTRENLQKCRCNECPSYTIGCKVKNYPVNLLRMIEGMENAEHFEGMFCAYGTSKCIAEDRGCLCENCDVFHENNLHRDEFCLPLQNSEVKCNGSQCRA